MDKERMLKSFELADAAVKHMLGLATASIGGAIALFDTEGAGVSLGSQSTLVVSGIFCLVGSITGGLCAVLNLFGLLGNSDVTEPNVYKPSVRLFVSVQLGFFFLGMMLLALATFGS